MARSSSAGLPGRAFERFARSIFQSKDDPEIGFRFQYKVILKSEGSAAQRPVSFLGFWFKIQKSRSRRREPRVGKWETWFRFSTFPSGAMPGCGNVGISRLWRDFQGAVERGEKLLLLFHAFHGPGISIALPVRPHAVSRASGDSLLQRLSKATLAALIFRAHSVSLIVFAVASRRAKLMPSFK